MKILIATTKVPRDNAGFVYICDAIRGVAKEKDLDVVGGILYTNGAGCANLAFEVEGDDDEASRLANELTMAFMPARWTTTTDHIPSVDTFDLEK